MTKSRTVYVLVLVAVVGSPLVVEGQDPPCVGHGLYEPYGMFSRVRLGAAYFVDPHLSQNVRFAQAYTRGDDSGDTEALEAVSESASTAGNAAIMVMSAPRSSISETRENVDRKPVFLAAHAAQDSVLTYLPEPCSIASIEESGAALRLQSGYYDLELLQDLSGLDGVAERNQHVQGPRMANHEGLFYTWDPKEVISFSGAHSGE